MDALYIFAQCFTSCTDNRKTSSNEGLEKAVDDSDIGVVEEEGDLLTEKIDAEERFLVDIGSLFIPSSYPVPAHSGNQNQGIGFIEEFCLYVYFHMLIQLTVHHQHHQ